MATDHAAKVREFIRQAVWPRGNWQRDVEASLDALVAERDEARRIADAERTARKATEGLNVERAVRERSNLEARAEAAEAALSELRREFRDEMLTQSRAVAELQEQRDALKVECERMTEDRDGWLRIAESLFRSKWPGTCGSALVEGAAVCALPSGHEGVHVPLSVLWQEAGYADGPWAVQAVREPVAAMVKVGGKRFFCSCGANVFTKTGEVFRCNGCGVEYSGVEPGHG